MANYGEHYNEAAMGRQRDVVLSINEFCFLQNKTNGSIKSHVGPLTMTISAQEALVVFDEKTKKFTEVSDFERAKQTAYAETVAKIMSSVSPELVAALTSTANASMLETVTKSMSPYAIARGESVAEVTDKLLRGITLEGVLEGVAASKIK